MCKAEVKQKIKAIFRKMQLFPNTIVIRHFRENLKKCSLRGLESRSDFQFYSYPHFPLPLPSLANMILLTLDAPPLSAEDKDRGLLLLDGTWRYAAKMEKYVKRQCNMLIPRSLPPHYRTAYPRVQNDCIDPEKGLASVEALYLCYHLLGRETKGLLDLYHWKDLFLEKNQLTFK